MRDKRFFMIKLHEKITFFMIKLHEKITFFMIKSQILYALAITTTCGTVDKLKV